jgi:tRNA-specific 2-thiouridylase
VGEYQKSEIREMAESLNLPAYKRPDSQDLCFLAGEDYRNFIQRNAAEILVPGEIVRQNGGALGQHNGLANYTIGQRKGLGVSSPVPLYVLGKDVATNTLIVGEADELGTDELTANDVNWISNEERREPFQAEVKIRYTAREVGALVTPLEDGKRVRVRFDVPQRDVTPGQAAVFYEDDLLLGGGIIT